MDWSWAGPPLDVRALFPAERAELLALLRSLDPADWQRATVCPGWRVHDVAAHLVHDYLRKLSGGTRRAVLVRGQARIWPPGCTG